MADTYIPNSTGNRKLIDNGDGTLIMDAWFDNVSLKLTTPTGRSAA